MARPPMRDFEDYCWRELISPQVRYIYSPYVRERNVGTQPALLVVHPGIAVAGPWTEAAVQLLDAARARGIPVVHSVPPDTRAATALAARATEALVARPCESAFFSSDLERVLTRLDAQSLVLCGAPTSGAVRASAVEGKSFGYRVALAEEAVGDLTAMLHQLALFDIAHKYGDVMALDELLDQPTFTMTPAR
ncbi:MAG: isochorismatase family protein [Proteobacteria bacterium]|nr:isochorismatase family protein [Burkholderiales bacterium]